MAATSVEMNEGRLCMRLACWLTMHCPSSKCTSRGVSEPQQLHSNLPEHYGTDPSNYRQKRNASSLRIRSKKDSAVLQNLSHSASMPHDRPHPMAPGEWNGNHNDRAFPMVGVRA